MNIKQIQIMMSKTKDQVPNMSVLLLHLWHPLLASTVNLTGSPSTILNLPASQRKTNFYEVVIQDKRPSYQAKS